MKCLTNTFLSFMLLQPMFDIQVEEDLRWEKKESGKAGMNKKQAFKTLRFFWWTTPFSSLVCLAANTSPIYFWSESTELS